MRGPFFSAEPPGQRPPIKTCRAPGYTNVPDCTVPPRFLYGPFPTPKRRHDMLDDIQFLDDSTRPEAPELEGVTEHQKLPGQHLAMIHDHFRSNMQHLRDLIARAAEGEVSTAALKAETENMEMLQNYRQFGALCGQHCQIIHQHHSIEDQAIFPTLGSKSAAFKRVVDRLQQEHVIVHDLLVRLIDAINTLITAPDPENFATVRELYDALEKVLLSHFGYEEDSIGDALGFYEIGV